MRLAIRTIFASVWLFVGVSASGVIHYVDANSANPIAPYTNWATAAEAIQDAVDVAGPIDEVVVTNGIYRTGGRTAGSSTLTNRLVLIQPIVVRSVNGPSVTLIQGYQVPFTINGSSAVRCVYLYPGATLSGFTLTNGATRADNINGPDGWGGGVYSYNGTVSNCVFVRNVSAYWGGGVFSGPVKDCVFTSNQSGIGGGAYACALDNCTFTKNQALNSGGAFANCPATNCFIVGNHSGGVGGGVYGSDVNYLVNCTVVSNTAGSGGGVYQSFGSGGPTVVNSIMYYNSATNGPDCAQPFGAPSFLGWCCTSVPGGTRVITNAPHFVNPASGDFHLLSDSPCINSGRNVYVWKATDRGGNPRVRAGTVDIGAYEFQNPLSVLSYAWLQSHGLPTDGSVDYADSDGDGMNNWQEWIANTDPTNSSSLLQMLSPDRTNALPGVTIHWPNAGVIYFIQRSTKLTGPFQTIVSSFATSAAIATYRDATATNTEAYFYRVGVVP